MSTFVQVNDQNNQPTFIKSTWAEDFDTVDLYLTNGTLEWHDSLSRSQLFGSKADEMDELEYLNHIKTALSGGDINDSIGTYIGLVINDLELSLTVGYYPEKDIKLKLLIHKFLSKSEQNPHSVQLLLNFTSSLIVDYKAIQASNTSALKRLKTSESNLARLEAKYLDAVDMHESATRDQYYRFEAILNNQKDKIQELRAAVEKNQFSHQNVDEIDQEDTDNEKAPASILQPKSARASSKETIKSKRPKMFGKRDLEEDDEEEPVTKVSKPKQSRPKDNIEVDDEDLMDYI